MTIPDWLTDPTAPADSGPRRSRQNFITKTLKNIGEFFTAVVRFEESATKNGLLQSIDARVKFGGLIGVLFLVGPARSIQPIAIVYAGCLGLAAASRLDLRRFCRRTAAPALFFTLPLALPAILNIVTPGPSALVLWSRPGGLSELTITYAGISSAGLFWFRSLTMITVSMLVLHTTPVHHLLKAMSSWRLPNLATTMTQMVWRYLFILVGLVNDLHLAKKSRTIKAGPGREERRWVTAGIGRLLNQSLRLSDEVTAAMISRGFSGHYVALPAVPLTAKDRLAAVGLLLILAALAIAVL